VRALASHQCGPGSFPARCHMWLSLLLVLVLAPRVFLSVRSISTLGNAQNNTLTSQHGGFEFFQGDSNRIFLIRVFSSLPSLLCPPFINTTTKKAFKKRHAKDRKIWRWNTRGGKVLLWTHRTTTPGFGIAWSS